MKPLERFAAAAAHLIQDRPKPSKVPFEPTRNLYENRTSANGLHPEYLQNERFWAVQLVEHDEQSGQKLVNAARTAGPQLNGHNTGICIVHAERRPGWVFIGLSSDHPDTARKAHAVVKRWAKQKSRTVP